MDREVAKHALNVLVQFLLEEVKVYLGSLEFNLCE